MESDTTRKDTRLPEESINQLSDENLSYFLGVLEALYFARDGDEIFTETEVLSSHCEDFDINSAAVAAQK